MKKRIAAAVIAILVYLSMIVSFADKNESIVEVKLASYNKIQIGNIHMDKNDSMYPILEYKDLVYFPLTAQYCSALDLDVNWCDGRGLTLKKEAYVEKENVSISSKENDYKANKKEKYYATIPSYNIELENVNISSNSNYPYPFLNFKGVTYAPVQYGYAESDFNCILQISEDEFRIYRKELYEKEMAEKKKDLLDVDGSKLEGEFETYYFKEIHDKYSEDKLEEVSFKAKVIERKPIHMELLIKLKESESEKIHTIQCFDVLNGIDSLKEDGFFPMLKAGVYVDMEGYLKDQDSNGNMIFIPTSMKLYK